ncbi:MAG TPA: DUF4474 domain-containing protein, partial [Clostridia bacterium]|nr:DUF4474 domain-containing protein [Clostridia bacterium]
HFTVLELLKGAYYMKNLLTKSLLLLFIVSLLFSFAACGKDKDDETTGVPTTAGEITTEFTTEQVAVSEPLSAALIEEILSSAGDRTWDGEFENLTDEQKDIIKAYFTDTAPGETVEFRDGNIYLVKNTDEVTTDPDAPDETQANTPGAGNVNKPQKTDSRVKSVTLNKDKLSMGVGYTEQLKAKITPADAKNKTLSWKSENNKVATVSAAGVVTAKSNGTTKITCTANDNKGISAICAVTVTAAPPTGAVLSYLYNEKEEFFYVEDDPWQRQFGFNRLYDTAANFVVMYIDTVRVKFNHRGKDWMIQLWKGQYGLVFIGAEIGVYTKDPSQTVDHYECASDADSLKMQMSFYDGNKWLFTRNYDTYWWITGFVPGRLPRFNDRSALTMLAMITLKDSTMRNYFVEGLKANGFKAGYKGFSTPDTYKIEDNTVHFNWRRCQGSSTLTDITFNATGGEGGMGPVAMEYGTEFMPPEVTKEGFILEGWKKAGRNEILEFPQTVPSGRTTYIAVWRVDS